MKLIIGAIAIVIIIAVALLGASYLFHSRNARQRAGFRKKYIKEQDGDS